MRLVVYGSFLIVGCAFIQSSLADNKYKRKDDENSVERPSKYGVDKKNKPNYKMEEDEDDIEEDYKMKYKKGLTKEKRDTRRDKIYVPEDEIIELISETKEKLGKIKESRPIKRKAKNTFEEDSKIKKIHSKVTKDSDEDDDDDEESSEEVPKAKVEKKPVRKHIKPADDSDEDEKDVPKKQFKKKIHPRVPDSDEDDDDDNDDDHDESSEEAPKAKVDKKPVKPTDDSDEDVEKETSKKQFRKKIRVRIPDSDENEEDEAKRGHQTCKKKSKGGRNGCPPGDGDAGGDETGDEPVRAKKIKYSIKFAHEKEKSSPSEDENIMRKIHRGDKKKYRYQDDDDGSSEEDTHPKRIHFADDDDD